MEKWGNHTRKVSDTNQSSANFPNNRKASVDKFGRLRRVSHETPAHEKDLEDPSMDYKPSGIRRKGVLARGGTWDKARPTRHGHTVDWARPSKTHVARREPRRRHASKPPTQPPEHASRGEKINLAGR